MRYIDVTGYSIVPGTAAIGGAESCQSGKCRSDAYPSEEIP